MSDDRDAGDEQEEDDRDRRVRLERASPTYRAVIELLLLEYRYELKMPPRVLR